MNDSKLYQVGDIIKARNNNGVISDAKIKFINTSFDCLIFVEDLNQLISLPNTSLTGKIQINESVNFNFDVHNNISGVIKEIKNTSHYFIEFDNNEKAIVNFSQVYLLNKDENLSKHIPIPESISHHDQPILKTNQDKEPASDIPITGVPEVPIKQPNIDDPRYKILLELLKNQIDKSVLLDSSAINSYSMKEIAFLIHMELYFEDEDNAITIHPKLHDMLINLYKLADVVKLLGGFENVKNYKRWKDVARSMGVQQSHVSTYKSLKFSYMRYIDPFFKHLYSSSKKACCYIFTKDVPFEITQEVLAHFKEDKVPEKNIIPNLAKFKEEMDSEDKLTSSNTQAPYYDAPIIVSSKSHNKSSPSKKHKSAMSSELHNSSSGNSDANSEDSESYITFYPGDKIHVQVGLKSEKKYEATVIRSKQKPNHTRYYVNYTNRDDVQNEWVHEKYLTLLEKGSQSDTRSTKDPHSGENKEKGDKMLSPNNDLSSSKRKSRATLNSRQDELLEEILKVSALEYNLSSVKIDESVVKEESEVSIFSDNLPIKKRKKQKIQKEKQLKEKPIKEPKKNKHSSSILQSPVTTKSIKLSTSTTTQPKTSPRTINSNSQRNPVVEKIKEKTNTVKEFMETLEKHSGSLSASELEKVLTESLQSLTCIRDKLKAGYEFCDNQLKRQSSG